MGRPPWRDSRPPASRQRATNGTPGGPTLSRSSADASGGAAGPADRDPVVGEVGRILSADTPSRDATALVPRRASTCRRRSVGRSRGARGCRSGARQGGGNGCRPHDGCSVTAYSAGTLQLSGIFVLLTLANGGELKPHVRGNASGSAFVVLPPDIDPDVDPRRG
jgi:hypothetical protein